MFIIVDKNTNKITQTIDKNYGIQVFKNELLQEVTDEFINKYNNAYEYKLVFKDGKIADIEILKTWEEWQNEQQLNPAIVDEKVDTEKVAMASAIVDLNNRIAELENKSFERW